VGRATFVIDERKMFLSMSMNVILGAILCFVRDHFACIGLQYGVTSARTISKSGNKDAIWQTFSILVEL